MSLFFIFINIPFFLQITDLGIYLMFNKKWFLTNVTVHVSCVYNYLHVCMFQA